MASPFQIVVTNPKVATKSCINGVTNWDTGTNRLTWNKLDRSAFQYWALYLQRSSVDNFPPYFPSMTQANVPAGPRADGLWTTIKSWSNAEVVHPNEPDTYDDVVQHSTFYYYRLILQVRATYTGVETLFGEIDSGIAIAVQPFDLSICDLSQTPQPCAVVQNCGPRLIWDSPQLFVPFIAGSHVGTSVCCNSPCTSNGCYKIHVDASQVPNTQTFDVYKSTVNQNSLGLVVTNAALNGNGDWFDDAAGYHGPIWYQFKANRVFSSVIPSNIVQLSY